ncbi:MAG: LacI family DNA-binding transcriptional regulator [Candidatus Omnitrophota bacterium]
MVIPKVFALVVPRFEDALHSFYASEIISGASGAASHLRVDILVHITERSGHKDWLSSPGLNLDCIDGALFADIDCDVKMLERVAQKGTPCLVLNNYLSGNLNCIAIDNKNGAVEAVEYLIGLGHRRIAIINGDLNTQAGRDRLEGYKVALIRNGIDIESAYIRRGNFLRSQAYEAAQALFRLRRRPTAIFAASDVMALEALRLAREKDIDVPGQLSVVGFDNHPLDAYSSLGLTTVSQPITRMGRMGVEILYRIVCGKTEDLPLKMLLPTRLVVRESCCRRR